MSFLTKCLNCGRLHIGGRFGICKTCIEEARQDGRCTRCCGVGIDLSYEHERDSRQCPWCGGTGDRSEDVQGSCVDCGDLSIVTESIVNGDLVCGNCEHRRNFDLDKLEV